MPLARIVAEQGEDFYQFERKSGLGFPFEAKCSAVFEHVYQSYPGEGQSVDAA